MHDKIQKVLIVDKYVSNYIVIFCKGEPTEEQRKKIRQRFLKALELYELTEEDYIQISINELYF